jgi:hypothetical protein
MPTKKQRAKSRRAAKYASAKPQPAIEAAQHREEVKQFVEANESCRSLADYMCVQCGSWGKDTIVHKVPAQLHRAQLQAIAQNLQGGLHNKGVHPHKMKELAGSPHRIPVCSKCMQRKY